jgi:hypothetical protein
MQLKNRIKKIEGRVDIGNTASVFCECLAKCHSSACEESHSAYKEGRKPDDSRILRAPIWKNGVCVDCKRNVSKDDIEYIEIIRDVTKIYEGSSAVLLKDGWWRGLKGMPKGSPDPEILAMYQEFQDELNKQNKEN